MDRLVVDGAALDHPWSLLWSLFGSKPSQGLDRSAFRGVVVQHGYCPLWCQERQLAADSLDGVWRPLGVWVAVRPEEVANVSEPG